VALADSFWRPLDNPFAMQWWYTTLIADDGLVVRCRLWARGARCGCEVGGYPGDGEPWALAGAFGADAFHGERERLLVMVAASSVDFDGKRLKLALRHDDLVLRVRAEPVVALGDTTFLHRLGPEQRFLWTVPMLRGRFEGSLRRDGAERAIRGEVFFDHVLADVRPSLDWLRNYRGWCWGFAWLDRISMLCLEVDFRRDPLRVAFLSRDDGPIRLHRPPPDDLFRWSTTAPPRFWIAPDGPLREVGVCEVHEVRQRVPGVPLLETAVNALPGIRKTHGLGELDGGPFWFEMARFGSA